MLDKKISIGKATFWSFAAEIAAKLITPIINIILARIIAPEAFGIIATINMVVSLADTFSKAGFQKYVVQHKFENKRDLYNSANVAFWSNMLVMILTWTSIFLFRFKIALAIGNSGYEKALVIAALALPLTGLSSIQEALFQREFDYRTLFVRRLVVSLVPFATTIPLALLGFDYWALIIGSISGCIVKAGLMLYMSKWKPAIDYSLSLLKEMFSFSFWTLLESIALWASTYIDIFIISNSLGNYYTGLYRNSQMLVTSILSLITGATTSVLFTSLSSCQDDSEKFKKVFFTFQKYTAVFVLPTGVLLFCLNELVTKILLGNHWMEASFFIGIWGLCTSIVCVFGTYCREVYRAKGRPDISLLVQVLHLLFIVPICIVFVNRGFHDFSIARSIAYLQIILVHFYFISTKFKISPISMIIIVKEPLIFSVIIGILPYFLVGIIPFSYYTHIAIGCLSLILYAFLLLMVPSYRNDANRLKVRLLQRFK